jgi:MurNAc alpha-1-phosphate uridylyltransferase
MKAMILAAGKGTRLGELTHSTPKALIDINGKSVLQLAVEKCTSAGFDDIIVNVHHFADMVEKELDNLNRKGFRVTVSDERELLLETGGGLFKARDFFDKDPFLLYNADIVTDLDLNDMLSFHIKHKGLATLAVRKRIGNRFFLVNQQGMVRGWYNRNTGEKILTGPESEQLSEIAFSGLHIIDPVIFNSMKEGVYTMTALYLQLAGSYQIFTYRHDTGYWTDIGTPENLESVRKMLNF